MKATVNGIETYYELHGKDGAPWLTLSHSLACSTRMWDPQIEALKSRYRILAYDTRGHGESMAPAGAYTLEQLADDLHALLRHLAIDSTHFVGLSMGGMIAQALAIARPERVLTLTSIMSTTGDLDVGAPTADAMQMLLRPPATTVSSSMASIGSRLPPNEKPLRAR